MWSFAEVLEDVCTSILAPTQGVIGEWSLTAGGGPGGTWASAMPAVQGLRERVHDLHRRRAPLPVQPVWPVQHDPGALLQSPGPGRGTQGRLRTSRAVPWKCGLRGNCRVHGAEAFALKPDHSANIVEMPPCSERSCEGTKHNTCAPVQRHSLACLCALSPHLPSSCEARAFWGCVSHTRRSSIEHESGGPQVQPPMLPTHYFLIDVSLAAVTSGATAAACSAVSQTLQDVPGALQFSVCSFIRYSMYQVSDGANVAAMLLCFD